MLHKIKRNVNYAFMEHDSLALLALGSGPAKPIVTEDTSCIPKERFSSFFNLAAINPDAPLGNTYNISAQFGSFATSMMPQII